MPSGLSASAISVRWRSLPSLLSTTPPTRTAGLYEAKPAATAAADCDCPDTSRTSSTGRPRRAARSEAAPERPGVPGTPSNSPIAPSITSTSALCVGVGDQRVDQRRRHRPAVEIDALGAGRRGMERGIDVVRSGLRRAHRDALPPQRAEQAERDQRLARAGARRRDDQAACAHRAASISATSLQQTFAHRDDVADHDEPGQGEAKLADKLGETSQLGDERCAVRTWSPTR